MGWSPLRQSGLIQGDARSFGGYTVIVPNGGDAVYLLGPEGKVVRCWSVPWFHPGYAYLTPQGTLLARGRLRRKTASGWEYVPDKSDILLELDWESNEVWRWDGADLHHGMHRMPNGNTLVIIWTPLPEGFHERIHGGLPKGYMEAIQEKDPEIWEFLLEGMGVGGRPKLEGHYGDSIVEVDPDGNIVKQWNAYDHLSPEEEPTCAFCPGAEWTHANSLDMTADGKVLISFREISLVAKIDWDTGEVVWKYGRPIISHQHDPSETPDGNILIFDNGAHHPIQGRSSVIEVEPASGKVIWRYSGDPVFSFRCLHIGGCQRLPNGNTMICEGECGRLLEVTPDKEICWNGSAPLNTTSRAGPTSRYSRPAPMPPTAPNWQEKTLAAIPAGI